MNYLRKSALRSTLALGFASIALTMTALSGCKKENPLGVGGCDDVVRKSQAFADALTAFQMDLSVANCQKLKSVGEDYLNAARKCTLYPKYKEAAEEALADWGTFDCSAYGD